MKELRAPFFWFKFNKAAGGLSVEAFCAKLGRKSNIFLACEVESKACRWPLSYACQTIRTSG